MIREASIYAMKKLPAAEQQTYGTRVLTMRRWPRGIARKDIDIWVPSAGPSVELLGAFHTQTVTWEQFLARYLEEQEQQKYCRVVSYEQSRAHHTRLSLCVARSTTWHDWSKNAATASRSLNN